MLRAFYKVLCIGLLVLSGCVKEQRDEVLPIYADFAPESYGGGHIIMPVAAPSGAFIQSQVSSIYNAGPHQGKPVRVTLKVVEANRGHYSGVRLAPLDAQLATAFAARSGADASSEVVFRLARNMVLQTVCRGQHVEENGYGRTYTGADLAPIIANAGIVPSGVSGASIARTKWDGRRWEVNLWCR